MPWWAWLLVAWGWGGWVVLIVACCIADSTSPGEVALILAWPVVVPAARFYHWWRFGGRRRRFVYGDLRWWQRGLAERRKA